jgi:hypothetical protein
MSKEELWDYWVLSPLRDEKPTHLKIIYSGIEELKNNGYIKPQLYSVDGRWGDRPDYTHIIRSTMSSLENRGMVKKHGEGKRTGIYRITDTGAKYLKEIEP